MLNFFKKISEIIFPSHCLVCARIISQNSLFCNDDWQELKFITDPKCKICSYPFEYNVATHQDLYCVSCLTKRPFYDRLVTIFSYNEQIKKAVACLKYNDATYLSKKFAELIFKKIKNEINNFDLIIAVPLHKKRLKKRKFNQSILLVQAIVKYNKSLKFYPDLMIRTKYNHAQVGLSKKQREKNLVNAFQVRDKYLSLIKNKKILLIDDVVTTGTTVNNCAKVLRKNGANEIVVLTIAKTLFH